jgi:hypothetical protein
MIDRPPADQAPDDEDPDDVACAYIARLGATIQRLKQELKATRAERDQLRERLAAAEKR